MELRAYFQILLRKWWLVSVAFLVTFAATVVLTYTQSPVYQATATFVVTPNTQLQDKKTFLSGLDVLSARSEIASTYTEVASSRSIKKLAADEMGLSSEQRKTLTIDSQLRAGTNVLQIQVQGYDQVLVRDFANMVGAKTVSYVNQLYEVYELKPLDLASTPGVPIKPNKMLNLTLGGIAGLVLGVGLAFLLEYLQVPLEAVVNLGILDHETGVHNKSYFMNRLKEEMSRAQRNGYPLSLAVIDIEYLKTSRMQSRDEVLRKVAALIKKYLREEDVMARISETAFALLLPDLSDQGAKEAMERLQARISWTPLELEESGLKLNLVGTAGIASYGHNGVNGDEFLARAMRALQAAEEAGEGQLAVWSEGEGQHSQVRGKDK